MEGEPAGLTINGTAIESAEVLFESKARAVRLTVPVAVGVHVIVKGAAALVPMRAVPA